MPAKLTFATPGEATRTLLAKAAAIEKSLERAAYKFGQIQLTEMKRRTPVEFGTLRDSGDVKVEWKGRWLVITWSFGGASASYAIYVHEDLDAHHETGQAKFVESVINENAQGAPRAILEDAAETMGL